MNRRSETLEFDRHTYFVEGLLSAVVPVVEVVPAVVFVSVSPLPHGFGVVLHAYAFLELSVEVFAPVASVHWDLQGVQLFLGVLLWLKVVIGL